VERGKGESVTGVKKQRIKKERGHSRSIALTFKESYDRKMYDRKIFMAYSCLTAGIF
jgi:hypothetical protein